MREGPAKRLGSRLNFIAGPAWPHFSDPPRYTWLNSTDRRARVRTKVRLRLPKPPCPLVLTCISHRSWAETGSAFSILEASHLKLKEITYVEKSHSSDA